MNHSLNVEVAKKLGVNAALIIANLAYLQHNRQAQGGEKYHMDGRWWVHHTYESLATVHPYFSIDQIRRIMKSLVEQKAVFKCNPDHFKRDCYWSVALEFTHVAKSPDASGEIAGSETAKSPVVLHDNKHITTTPCSPPSRFTPPTVSEVSDYFSERGGDPAEGERFVDFYESKGWLVGKSKMKSWKAAVRNWVSRSKSEKPRNSTELARRNSQAVSGDFKRSDTSWIEQG
jgi:hypothetical protein